jgi:6-phosphogluconolactonase
MSSSDYHVLDDFDQEAADYLAQLLADEIGQRGVIAVALAGGGTPLGVYRRLAGLLDGGQWGAIHLFWGDERLVPPDHPESNYAQARAALLSRAPIPPENVHRVRGELPAAEAAADYAEQLRGWAATHDPGAPHPWPRFGLVLLGLGGDGHTASLFPGSPVEAAGPVVAVTADYEGRPAERVTLTPLVFNDARRVVFLVAGGGKAEAVRDTLNSDDPARYPAQRIRPTAGWVTWLFDSDAAGSLDENNAIA